MTGAAVMIVGYGIMGLASENLTLLIAGCILRGVGNAGISACMFAMVTDTIEYGDGKQESEQKVLSTVRQALDRKLEMDLVLYFSAQSFLLVAM